MWKESAFTPEYLLYRLRSYHAICKLVIRMVTEQSMSRKAAPDRHVRKLDSTPRQRTVGKSHAASMQGLGAGQPTRARKTTRLHLLALTYNHDNSGLLSQGEAPSPSRPEVLGRERVE